jgi:hypothetical protein
MPCEARDYRDHAITSGVHPIMALNVPDHKALKKNSPDLERGMRESSGIQSIPLLSLIL